MPAIAALAYHRASGRDASTPNQRLSYSENFLYMLDAANKPSYRCAAVQSIRLCVSALLCTAAGCLISQVSHSVLKVFLEKVVPDANSFLS